MNPNLIKEEYPTSEIDETLLIKRLSELDKKLEKLVSLYLDDSLSVDFLNVKKEEIEVERKGIENKLLDNESNKPELKQSEAIDILNSLKSSVLKLDYEKQKNLVRKLIKKITMKDDEMALEWRFTV
ncbi:hypothetical protein [Vagococcus carniphilus]|uniref:hypothetical protein n=1 Tax=Vagococcus carniphilus TaxID=218144 RepID=UPI002892F8BB|nr:hypothetical protein [Vagococcus carniphilus]